MENLSALVAKDHDYEKLKQILDKVRELKQSLAKFFLDYEREQPSWPSLLDKMTVLSSQVNNLRSSIRNILPILRNHSVTPMCLSPEADPEVQRLTERRLDMFNHEFMPIMLATKNLPEIEERERLLTSHSMSNGSSNYRPMAPGEVHARVQELNAILNYISESFAQTKQNTEKSDKAFDQHRFSNAAETKRLIDAMNNGTGLRPSETGPPPAMANTEASNVNPAMAAQNARGPSTNVRIKMTSKPNR